jgi:hypothetical protein
MSIPFQFDSFFDLGLTSGLTSIVSDLVATDLPDAVECTQEFYRLLRKTTDIIYVAKPV